MKPKSTIRLSAGTGSRWTGWQKRIADTVDQLAADVEGLGLRLKNPARPGIPAAFRAVRVFEPETGTINVDTEQDGASSNPVNYVLRDGQTYDIPCRFMGDGVFVMNRVKVAITQRVFVTPFGRAVDIPCPVLQVGFANRLTAAPNENAQAWTTKFSVFPKQPEGLVTGNFAPEAVLFGAVSYFWNMRDDRTGRYLASDLMPCTELQPTYVAPALFMAVAGNGTPPIQRVPISNGGFYEVRTPWMFERDGQATLHFRPITPIFQFDSSLAGTNAAVGLTYDDREGGKRIQPVTVAVEYHGYRYRTDQDAVRAGALTRY
jgi:hypothetical protein